MSYYEEFKKALPSTEEKFPPYLFTMIDIVRRADSEIAELKNNNADLGKSLEEIKADLKTAQETNIEAILSSEVINSETTTEEVNDSDTIPTITQIMDGVSKETYVLDF